MTVQGKRIAASVGLIVVVTVVSVWMQDFLCGAGVDLKQIGHKLDEVPAEFGDWRTRGTNELGQVEGKTLQCAGFVGRTYENQQTGEIVSAEVLFGPTGPIAAHTPEVCAASVGGNQNANRMPLVVDSSATETANFWSVILDVPRSPAGARVQNVCYGWSVGDGWQSPESARWTFFGEPYLYKIQVSCVVPTGEETRAMESCRHFLKDFLPVLKNYLVPAP
ncbi:MAG: hypothetical protein JW818_11800 [Pirellulales bacterium]|nr:hypothetical protein [Pirellulales bacterium]